MKSYLKAISDRLNEILQEEDTPPEFFERNWDERRGGMDRRFEREIFGGEDAFYTRSYKRFLLWQAPL